MEVLHLRRLAICVAVLVLVSSALAAEPKAFDVLYRQVRNCIETYDSAYERAGGEDEETIDAYNVLVNAVLELAEVSTKQHTAQLMELLDFARTSYSRERVVLVLAEKGDPKVTVSVLYRLMQTDPESLSKDAWELVFHSSRPEIVSYMIDALGNPKADSYVRKQAFCHLAATGGDAGLKAVLAARGKKRRITTIAEAMELDTLCPQVVAPNKRTCDNPACNDWMQLIDKKTGADGTVWGLIACGIAGCVDDLWVVRYDGEHWTSPAFTGVTRDKIGKSDWLSRFAENAAVRKDSDGDGWTDLLESRFGTDPRRADTDGDGLRDSEDMNPLAAPRQLADNEMVLKAAFEALNQFDAPAGSPCLMELPKGIKPFEVANWGWVVLQHKPGAASPMDKLRQPGRIYVDYDYTSMDFAGKRTERGKPPYPGAVILWNADRTEALVQVGLIAGPRAGTGHNIRVRRFGREWVVVDVEMAWIS